MSTEVMERFNFAIEAEEARVDEVFEDRPDPQLELPFNMPAVRAPTQIDPKLKIAWKQVRFGVLFGSAADFDLIMRARVTKWNDHSVYGLEAGEIRSGTGHLPRRVLERKLGRPLLPGMEAHHINHNRLDNRRENLEEVTHRENTQSRRKSDRAPRQFTLPIGEVSCPVSVPLAAELAALSLIQEKQPTTSDADGSAVSAVFVGRPGK